MLVNNNVYTKEAETCISQFVLSHHAKSVPPKIGPARPILVEKSWFPRPLLLPKVVRLDQFWLPKLVPSCQNQSPMGDQFWLKNICQNQTPHKVALFIHVHASGTGLGGPRGPVPPFKIFYLYVTATIYSMKILFNDVLSFINVTNYVYSYIIYRCW